MFSVCVCVCVCFFLGGGGGGRGRPVRRYYFYENTIENIKGQHITYSSQSEGFSKAHALECTIYAQNT